MFKAHCPILKFHCQLSNIHCITIKVQFQMSIAYCLMPMAIFRLVVIKQETQLHPTTPYRVCPHAEVPPAVPTSCRQVLALLPYC